MQQISIGGRPDASKPFASLRNMFAAVESCPRSPSQYLILVAKGAVNNGAARGFPSIRGENHRRVTAARGALLKIS